MSSLSVAGFWIVLIAGIWWIFASLYHIAKLPESERMLIRYCEATGKDEIIEEGMIRVLWIKTVVQAIIGVTMGLLLVFTALGVI